MSEDIGVGYVETDADVICDSVEAALAHEQKKHAAEIERMKLEGTPKCGCDRGFRKMSLYNWGRGWSLWVPSGFGGNSHISVDFVYCPWCGAKLETKG